jgi:hypothetical protein
VGFRQLTQCFYTWDSFIKLNVRHIIKYYLQGNPLMPLKCMRFSILFLLHFVASSIYLPGSNSNYCSRIKLSSIPYERTSEWQEINISSKITWTRFIICVSKLLKSGKAVLFYFSWKCNTNKDSEFAWIKMGNKYKL